MILALFALAVVMIVGGIASVVQGFPYVRLESGWTMTIAGAATASSGALLLGLAVVATYLKRLERAVLEQGGGLGVDPSAFEAGGRIEPPGLGATDVADEPVSPGRHRPSAVGLAEPRLASPPLFADDPAPALPIGSDPASPLLPDLLPEPPPPTVADTRQSPVRAVEPDAEAAPARRIKPNKPPRAVKPTAMVDTVIPAPEPAPILADAPPAPAAVPPSPPREAAPEEPLGLRSSVVDEPEPAPAPAQPAEADPAASTAKGGLAVVGKYASGGNTYVMYSNGSIEADTPRGQFTFDSLDELKAFVEAGGEEGAARGAA